MKYTKEQHKEVFNEWLQGIFSHLKRDLINDPKADGHSITIEVPDDTNEDYVGEVKITVNRKEK